MKVATTEIVIHRDGYVQSEDELVAAREQAAVIINRHLVLMMRDMEDAGFSTQVTMLGAYGEEL